MAKRPGIYGPYRHGDRWRLLTRRRDGSQAWTSFARRDLAQHAKSKAEEESERRGTTIEAAIVAFESHIRDVRKLKERSIETRIGGIERLHAGVDELEDVTPERARRLYRTYAASRAPATHRQTLVNCKTMWKWLAEEGWVARSPFDGVVPEGVVGHGKPQLTIDEARLFDAEAVKQATRDPGAVAALMALELGLRATEIVTRQVRDLDDGGRVMRIERGKTRASTRAIEVQEPLRSLLGALAANRVPVAYLFPGDDEGHRGRQWVWESVNRICKAAGVQGVSAHGLRGTFSTIGQASGVATRAVSDALGHTATSMTRRHYTDEAAVAVEDQRRRMAVLKGGRE